MKLLIIAGPYEADRIRKAALTAGFETVAVEPGESLSGWITASRPELIVMAPQIVHADPALALSKVRAVPRGRVPIFLVGDATDEARMRDLADGFFVRPVAPELLLQRARAILSPGRSSGSGPRRAIDPFEQTDMGIGPAAPIPTPAPAVGSGGINAAHEFARGGRTPKSGPHGQAARSGGTLKPLVAATGSGGATAPARTDAHALLADLDAGIDALFEAELSAAVARAPGPSGTSKSPPRPGLRSEVQLAAKPPARPDATPAAKPNPEPLAELAVESSAERDPDPKGEPAAVAAVQPVAPPDFAEEPTKKAEANLLGAALQAMAGERARARLLARYAPVEEGDYFAVLGVGRDADAAELRRAHQQILRELAPDAVGAQVARDLAAQIDAIRAVAGEALRVLTDDGLRPRYLSHLSE
jgi:hypothetical protein